jgi:hypothetical protein
MYRLYRLRHHNLQKRSRVHVGCSNFIHTRLCGSIVSSNYGGPGGRLIVGHFSRGGGSAGSLVIDRLRRRSGPGSGGVVASVCCAGAGRRRRLQNQERSKLPDQGRRR